MDEFERTTRIEEQQMLLSKNFDADQSTTYMEHRNQSILQTLRNYIKSLIYYYFPGVLKKKKIDFIFMVHVRYVKDYEQGMPFIKWLRFILPEKIFVRIMQKIPPAAVDVYETDKHLTGLMVCSALMPSSLKSIRRDSIENELYRLKRLVTNMCEPAHHHIVISLGGWWPMVSGRGKLFARVFKDDTFILTTGHATTVFSIIKTIIDLVKKTTVPLSDITIAVIGCGNVGENVALELGQRGVNLKLIDLNKIKLQKLMKRVKKLYPDIKVTSEMFSKESIRQTLSVCHMGVCATSNIQQIISGEDIPEHFIFIDDSRPEAIPRYSIWDNRYTLEGGLMKVQGVTSSYNFGFGNDHNLLGCMAEAVIIAWDSITHNMLRPTLGEISGEILRSIDNFCQLKQIGPGEYKMGEHLIEEETLIQTLRRRHLLMTSV